MANYTKLWEAFASGEGMEGKDAISSDTQYTDRTKTFYDQIVGPTFYGQEEGKNFGSGYDKYIADFTTTGFEKAEAEFRTSIGDPFTSASDPFSWEKISRYDTSGGLEGRLQSLLEKELYSKGKKLGGEIGETYETDTSKNLQGYKEGIQAQREGITYSGLTGSQALASGTSGTTLRSGGNIGVAEDALIDIYKKTKTLGSDYRAGKKDDETSLESDLDSALTSYLDAIDKEKEDWYDAVIRDVHKFGDEFTPSEIADRLTGNQDWQCGYGQKWGGDNVGCIDEDVSAGEFRGNVCGIGQLWDGEQCVEMEGLDFTRDKWGLVCAGTVDECGVCGGDGSTCLDCAGVPNGGAIIDDCGVCGGNNSCKHKDNPGGTLPEDKDGKGKGGGKDLRDVEGTMFDAGIETNNIETNWQDMLSDISNYWDNTSDTMQDIHDSLPVLEKPTGSGSRGKGSSTWEPLGTHLEEGQAKKDSQDEFMEWYNNQYGVKDKRDSTHYARSGRRTSRNIYNFFNTPAQQEEEEEFERPWYDKTRP